MSGRGIKVLRAKRKLYLVASEYHRALNGEDCDDGVYLEILAHAEDKLEQAALAYAEAYSQQNRYRLKGEP